MNGATGRRLAFYGDDFTGSTDAMEALAQSGLRTVLFLAPPSAQLLTSRFADLACIGIAGTSRAMSPAEMDTELEPILDALWGCGAPIVHYKVCSTFDSAPGIGSASPMTAEQIRWAGENGFCCLRVPTGELVSTTGGEAARAALTGAALAALAGGHSVLLYTASGPDDPDIAATRSRLGEVGTGASASAKVLGAAMGRTARELLIKSGVRRVVFAGGDTSSYATRELGLYGLEMVAELAPGAPLCRGYSEDRALDGIEIALKGGQMGEADYFGRALGTLR